MVKTRRQPEVSVAPRPRRAGGLDALRGLAILLMCLSGLVPAGMPNWMYHGYYPAWLPEALVGGPPQVTEAEAAEAGGGEAAWASGSAGEGGWGEWQAVASKAFRPDWPSLTWVDVVFPMFLVAMGAAIPLSIAGRRRRGAGRGELMVSAGVRFLWLMGFGVYAQWVSPWFIEAPPSAATWFLGLGAMVPAGLLLTRLPKTWGRGRKAAVRAVGWVSAVGVVAWSARWSGRGFTWDQKDIILVLLAWSSLLVSWATLLAGRWTAVRLLLVLPVAWLAHHQAMRPGWRLLGDRFDGWMGVLQAPKGWLDGSRWSGPLPGAWLDLSGLYDFTWFKFSGLVVLGTLAGDAVVRWQQRGDGASAGAAEVGRVGGWRGVGGVGGVGLTVLGLAAVVGTLAGLKDYASEVVSVGGWWLVRPGAVWVTGVLPAGAAWWWVWRSRARGGAVDGGEFGGDGWLIVKLMGWGAGCLTAGALLAVWPGPALDTAFGYFEGGIKKGPPATLSWYLVSGGLTLLLLGVMTQWIDLGRGDGAGGGGGVEGWGGRGGWWSPWAWLGANGQNPMLAYLGIRNLLAPLVGLPWWGWGEAGARSLNGWVVSWAGGGWWGVGWAAVQTLGLAGLVMWLTRRRVVWRV